MKRKILFIFIMISIIFGQVGFANDFKIKTEAGINSYIKESDSFNFKIVVDSENDFSGEVILRVPIENHNINDAAYTSYHRNFEIIGGEIENINFQIGNVISRNNIINNSSGIDFHEKHEVVFKDEKGKTVYKKNIYPKYNELYDSYLLGILSDDSDGLRHMNVSILGKDGINGKIKSTKVNDFSNLEQLEIVNTIIIDNFNIEKLSENQIRILKEYVKSGGNIIIGTGINDKKVLKSLLNINTGSLEDIGINELGLNENLKRIRFNNNQLEEVHKNLVYQKKEGKGKYIIFTFSLSDENFVLNSNSNEFFQKSIRDNFVLDFTESNPYRNQSKLGSMNDYDLKRVAVNSLPNLKIIVYGFAIFILLIGPINYFILKKIDKLELLLITILIGSILFVVVINVMSSDSILKKDYANINTIVKFESGNIIEDSNIGVKFKSGNDTISLPNSDVTLIDDIYNQSESVIDIYESEESKKIKFNQLSNWEFKSLNLSRNIEGNFSPVIASIDEDDNLEIDFKNIYGYDLFNSYLYINGDIYSTEDFLMNEENKIKKKLVKSTRTDIDYNKISHDFRNKIRFNLEMSNENYIFASASNYKIDGLKIENEAIYNNSNTVFLIPLEIDYKSEKISDLEVKDFFEIKGQNIEKERNEGMWVENNLELIGDLSYKNFQVNSIDLTFNGYGTNSDYDIFIYNYDLDAYEKLKNKNITINKEINSGYIKSKLKIKIDSKDDFYFEMPIVKIEGQV